MNMTPEPLGNMEKAVLEKLLEGDLPELALLRAQLHSARVYREWTGAGFWTKFEVDRASPRLAKRERFQIAGVYGRHPELQAGIGFTLFVDNGAVESLEGYTYEEAWPTGLDGLTVEQEPAGQQRLHQIRELFRPNSGSS